ncbi:inorganic diphosphatase [Mycoplasmopsis anatis]|uniref:Inorganic pyrophosphatase n=2 Tax=Mycoplasmopsis anatis TaxID=171279 RepID=F9QED5_9BACT|nr:inorganic diphosphatase [Mycoplasmopsis anatis]AWX70464.1 inorganic diphosphatase [Mycoplasmopsis anatis]EGS28946.1 inorganic pyrophosphatase [Mycoplasmopsis anatis 1340]MBW0594792.1 inorganic diphosphatase [Mycoplasmopsis anatis]MBW0595601.1 inorganic diphosphatase [Mycoplasmopsis anatis]MBW0596338.1 inorganic diphosphatase [Mycoplasmopsis anatis]
MKNVIQVKIEIQKNSNIKYEYNRKTNEIEVDRILRGDFVYPCNYGFVPEALDWDGDELDVLVYSPEVFAPGVKLNARIIGAMKMIDDGETDTKLVAVHHDDYRLDKINSINDLPKEFIKSVETFFSTYKNWKRPGITSVGGFEDTEWALNEYEECVHLMNKYGKLSKEDFLKEMKSKHPEKYV